MTSLKQKLSAILVLSLFLLSVLPVGLADEGKSGVDVEVEADLDSDTADVEVRTESKTEVETEDNDSEVKEKEEVKIKQRDGSFKTVKIVKREVKEVKRDLHNARERLEDAKERYQEAKEEQHQQREKVLDLDKVAKRCDSEKRDCATLKKELREGVKNHLLKSAQVVERSLEKLTKTVEKMEDLSDEDKENALSLIADLNAELEAQKAKINAFTSETSQEEIRAAIKDLKELNQKVHKMQRRLVGLLVNAKLHILVEKQAELHAGMQARIDALAETGADVSELTAILAKFDAKTAELEQDYLAAQQKWMEAKDAGDFDQFNRNVREAQHEVREDLQDLKKILRDFLHEHKDIKQDSEEETEDESENETEEASEDADEENEVSAAAAQESIERARLKIAEAENALAVATEDVDLSSIEKKIADAKEKLAEAEEELAETDFAAVVDKAEDAEQLAVDALDTLKDNEAETNASVEASAEATA